ncbi:MAG: PP2C family protein-serine/threonine phosphatase, partial [Ignavibacteria bacterium]
GNKLTNQDFTDDEIEFIESLGSIAAISLENIRLFRETLEMQRIEEDIRIAREIQRNLFPSKFPQSQSFEFYGFNEPSKQVGGDYFDVFRINENQILILIADVVGKGVPASLVMSNLQATVKALTRIPFELKKATTVLNNLMKQNLNTGNFITFFWGTLDEKNKTFQYVNAGHNPPILIRNNEIIRLDKGGIILGVLELNQDYNSETIQLNENDLICLFTDGFIEAVDKNEIEFGEDKFIQKLIEYKSLPIEIIANRLIEEVISFADNSSSMDDLTILLTKVK